MWQGSPGQAQSWCALGACGQGHTLIGQSPQQKMYYILIASFWSLHVWFSDLLDISEGLYVNFAPNLRPPQPSVASTSLCCIAPKFTHMKFSPGVLDVLLYSHKSAMLISFVFKWERFFARVEKKGQILFSCSLPRFSFLWRTLDFSHCTSRQFLKTVQPWFFKGPCCYTLFCLFAVVTTHAITFWTHGDVPSFFPLSLKVCFFSSNYNC